MEQGQAVLETGREADGMTHRFLIANIHGNDGKPMRHELPERRKSAR